MGYDLHITRRRDWSAEGNDITAEEWLAYVERDPQLQLRAEQGSCFAEWSGASKHEGPWFDWSDGQIYSKNPDEPVIDKMVEMARHFHAVVQGDDGELYDGGDSPPRERTLSIGERLADWWRRIRPARRAKVARPQLPFGVGDRVRDTFGNEHTVIAIQWAAQHGYGMIQTRRDDGAKIGHMIEGHYLTPVGKDAK